MLPLFLALLVIVRTRAECPNACSGNGECGHYDECTCHRNWQGADCSLRTCQFGIAHADSPKGDLDSSGGKLTGPSRTIIVGSTVYPYGTQEQFPNMTDTAGNTLSDTAHYYMECSNKGICDRSSGQCACFSGYEGSSCQRASCPNDCSGRGTCETISRLAQLAGGNEYNLWDADITLGCACDPGYSGPDCSEQVCKFGIDPLYHDDDTVIRVEGVTYRIDVNITGDADRLYELTGAYALRFFDVTSKEFKTSPIQVGSGCSAVQDALEGLPNKVVPKGSVQCSYNSGSIDQHLQSVEYSLVFTGNPGYLKQLEVDLYLDGVRPTVFAKHTVVDEVVGNIDIAHFGSTVSIFNTGMTGEFVDYFANQCRRVSTTLTAESVGAGILKTNVTSGAKLYPELNSGYYLSLDVVSTKLLKQCLGDSDGNFENNVEVFDWDFGSVRNIGAGRHSMMSNFPHAIKLVELNPASEFVGGMHYLTWWEPVSKQFVIANFPSAAVEGKRFAVYATDAVVEKVNINKNLDIDAILPSLLELETGVDGDEIEVRTDINPHLTTYFVEATNVLYTSFDTSCTSSFVTPCLSTGDMVFVLDSNYLTHSFNPNVGSGATMPDVYANAATYESGNLYTIKKIYSNAPSATTFDLEDRYRIVLDKNIPFAGDFSTAHFSQIWKNSSAPISKAFGVVNLFKFTPAKTKNYEYVSQCSNRGTCDGGACTCFKGYTGDNCQVQSALSGMSGSSFAASSV